MIKLREWMELVGYRITDGTAFMWSCYGPHAHRLNSWNEVSGTGGYDFSITFDTKNQTVYEVEAYDLGNDVAYRLINPLYIDAYKAESILRNVPWNQSCDESTFVDLEHSMDFLRKAKSIMSGETTRTVEVIEDPENPGNLILPFPEEFVKMQGWEPGDTLDWVDNNDGTWTIKKRSML